MHVNLILDTERRSASPVPMTVLIRLLVATLVLLALLAAFSFFSAMRNLQHEVRWAEDAWKQTEPKFKAAVQLRNDLAFQKSVWSEISGWRSARIEWGQQLAGLQRAVLPTIQLTDLRVVQHVLVLSNNVPGRVFEMRLTGRTGGPRPESNVSALCTALVEQAPFFGSVDDVSIPPGTFRRDPSPDAAATDRIFEMACKYRPRVFE